MSSYTQPYIPYLNPGYTYEMPGPQPKPNTGAVISLQPAPTPTMDNFFVPPMAMGEDPQKYYEKLQKAFDEMYKAYQDATRLNQARQGNSGFPTYNQGGTGMQKQPTDYRIDPQTGHVLPVFDSPKATTMNPQPKEITLSEYNSGLQDLKRRMEAIQKMIDEESTQTKPSPLTASPTPLTAAPPVPTPTPPAPQPTALSSSSGTTGGGSSYTAAMTSKSTGSQTQTKTQTQAPVWKPGTSRINLRTGKYIT